MISPKILRNLKKGQYIIYNSIYTYTLIVYRDNSFHIKEYGSLSGTVYVYEKDFESLKFENREDSDFYEDYYKYLGYTNRWSCITGIGGITVHGDFSFFDLFFYGEIRSEETVKEFRKFRDVMGLGFDRTHKKREIKERIKEQKNDSTRL